MLLEHQWQAKLHVKLSNAIQLHSSQIYRGKGQEHTCEFFYRIQRTYLTIPCLCNVHVCFFITKQSTQLLIHLVLVMKAYQYHPKSF